MTSLPEFLWHGTPAEYLGSILRSRLDPKASPFSTNGTCLTTERKVAAHFGYLNPAGHYSPIVLIRVPSTLLDPEMLSPDATLMLSPYGQNFRFDYTKVVEYEDKLIRYQQSSWQDSLTLCSGVSYNAHIEVTPDMVDVSMLGLRSRTYDERIQIEVDGIEPEDCLTPDEPVFVEDPLALALRYA